MISFIYTLTDPRTNAVKKISESMKAHRENQRLEKRIKELENQLGLSEDESRQA